jgi:hypothetical protein
MNQHFIKIKNLQGELVLSQKKDGIGISVTTKEMFFQKPHHTYHILFKDILSIVPYQPKPKKSSISFPDELQVHSSFTHQLYRVTTSGLVIINRNGRFIQHGAELILPLSQRFLEKVGQYSDLTLVSTS